MARALRVGAQRRDGHVSWRDVRAPDCSSLSLSALVAAGLALWPHEHDAGLFEAYDAVYLTPAGIRLAGGL